jgi:hypothetical protein
VTGPYRAVKGLKDGDAVKPKEDASDEGGGEDEDEEGDAGVEVEVD